MAAERRERAIGITGGFRKIVATAATVLAVLAAGSSNALGGQSGVATSTTTTATVGVVVVHTTLAQGGGETAATGIVLSSSGQVLTNNHVIRGASAIRVTVPSPARTYTATVAGYSVSKDVALLELRNAQGLQTVAIGSSAALEVGDRVTSVGNAGGTGVLSTRQGDRAQAVDHGRRRGWQLDPAHRSDRDERPPQAR